MSSEENKTRPSKSESRSRRYLPRLCSQHHLQTYLTTPKNLALLTLSHLLPKTHAQGTQPLNCSLPTDTFVGNAQAKFFIGSWIDRGICVRAHNVDGVCYATLLNVLDALNSLRQAEYNGSAGVLSLLPTIGALLGAPTNEIWRLLTIVPFGGGLAMLLSFGGAILPIRIEDYENSLSTNNAAIGSIVSFRRNNKGDGEEGAVDKSVELLERLDKRMQQSESQRIPKGYLWFGFLGMVLLFLASQAAMIIIEQGSVLPWWCVSRWWMHFWYFLVTLTAVAENYVQLPFSHQYKLFVSDVPYDIEVEGGDDMNNLSQQTGKGIRTALNQLSTLKAATLTMRGSQQYTRPRNTVLIMVSVVDSPGEQRLSSLWRLLSKACSIAIFVTGTAFFASVQLLALPMAVMVLVLVLSAGVFGRAIASWIVNGVEKSEPMLHVIANTTDEACRIIARILTLDQHLQLEEGGGVRNLQVEIQGHVFVGSRRVAKRSPWFVRVLGIMAHPMDLRAASSMMRVTSASEDGSAGSRVRVESLVLLHHKRD